MTANDVFNSPQFSRLSEQQQKFLREYVANGWDKIEAAKAAWQCKDDRSAASQADRALRNPRIAQLIALIDPAKCDMTQDEALQLLAKHARTGTKAAEVIKCLELIGEWRGWGKETPATSGGSEKSLYDQAEDLRKQ